MKAIVIMNEQHSLLTEQKLELKDVFKDSWEIKNVPASGWTRQEQEKVSDKLINSDITHVVFVSPLPLLIRNLSYEYGRELTNPAVLVFHNDKREKKELPNGKVISVVAKTGWKLV